MADGQPGGGHDIRFSHDAIGVSILDRSLGCCRDVVLGMDPVFDRALSDEPFAGPGAGLDGTAADR